MNAPLSVPVGRARSYNPPCRPWVSQRRGAVPPQSSLLIDKNIFWDPVTKMARQHLNTYSSCARTSPTTYSCTTSNDCQVQ